MKLSGQISLYRVFIKLSTIGVSESGSVEMASGIQSRFLAAPLDQDADQGADSPIDRQTAAIEFSLFVERSLSIE